MEMKMKKKYSIAFFFIFMDRWRGRFEDCTLKKRIFDLDDE